jgi:hypothetical protein
MKLIPLDKQKPKKGQYYILFSQEEKYGQWNCCGPYLHKGIRFKKCHPAWEYWTPFVPTQTKGG